MKVIKTKTLQNMSLSLRTLTLKSKLNIGKYGLLTVQDFINLDMQKDLVEMYYKYSKLNYNQEIKDILGITKDNEISKPGTGKVIYPNKLPSTKAKKGTHESLGKLIVSNKIAEEARLTRMSYKTINFRRRDKFFYLKNLKKDTFVSVEEH